MLIYSAEKDIEEQILSSNSMALYSQPVEKMDVPTAEMVASAAKISQKTPKTSDLYYTRSVYVSTNWNKNADIFLPEEVWAARYTPVDKQTNIGHDHGNVVGHIVSTWAIAQDGSLIDSETPFDKVPDFFHLCNGGVIYTRWQDEEMQMKTDALIHRIEEGEESVSMECLFSNFDYALRSEGSDDVRVIPRNDDTAFLTKRLRAFGGSGEYDGYEVGRVLRNITYSGKGYVPNPANPYSQIFSNDKISRFSFASSDALRIKESRKSESSGVYNKDKEKNDMSDTNKEVELLNVQLQEAKAELASQRDASKALQKDLAEKQANEHSSAIASLEKEIEGLKESLKEEKDAKACMCNQYEELKAKHEELEKQHAESVERERLEKRLSALKAKNLSDEDAQAKFDATKAFSDENFAIILEMIPSATAEKKENFKSEAEDDESDVDEKLAPADADVKDETPGTADVDATQASEYEDLMSTVASFLEKKFEVKKESK